MKREICGHEHDETQRRRADHPAQAVSGGNWKLLAAFAWEHYQKQGRGAVVADERDFVHAEVPQFTGIHLRYVAENTALLKEIGGWPGEREANWVATYDPAIRVVVFIVRDNDGISGYLAGTIPRPPEAFAQQQAEGN